MDFDAHSKRKKSKKKGIVEFDEPLEQPGKIYLAEIHGSAQRLLKIKKLSKYIRFCKCCLLPSETPGVVMPYTCLDNRKEFGLGIHLYFYYIQFCLFISIISLCLSSIPTIVFSNRYSKHLNDHCRNYYNDVNNSYNYLKNNTTIIHSFLTTNISNCLKYLSLDQNSEIKEDLSSIIRTDWILKMSADNLKNYYIIFKDKANNPKNIQNIPINFSFLYFLTCITLLIINYFFLQYINLLIDKEDFEETSPKDFTILVHGVKRPPNDKNISRKQILKDLLTEISDNYFKLEIHDIIPCYNLVQLYKLTKDVNEDKVKIYHAHNFKRQKDLHKKYMAKIKNNPYYGSNNFENNINSAFNEKNTNNNSHHLMMINENTNTLDINENKENEKEINQLNYYKNYFCYIKPIPLSKIEERINQNKKKIKEIEADLLSNPDKYNCGTYFVIFKYISMRDKIYAFFPTNFHSRIFAYIKYFFQNVMFGFCVNEKTKRINYLRTSFTIEHATEAYEVQWQNMGYSSKTKCLYLLISVFVTILLFGTSLCIVIGLNELQFHLIEINSNRFFLKYFFSFLISISIAIINSLARYVLKIITSKFEAIETRTNHYISLSIKISIFTFINTDIIPLLSNYIRHDWGNNDILLNNLLMIFITNITLSPFIFYFGPELCYILSRRAKARIELQGIPPAESKYTQRELNRIFENPTMNLCYKYSYLINVLLTTLFYMSIFPIGAIFSIVALILCYFLEIFYLGFYKRPEEINERLCKFFLQNFRIVIAVFCIGNYIFLHSIKDIFKIDWTLINLIIFIVIVFIPYHSLRINFIGITEGEAQKGSYDEYSLMFPTDYEKENPLTKKSAMIKHFKKLEAMNIIDKYQSEYLINNIKKESVMDNYYKNSKNVGNLLNSFEFQRQFVKLKKKYKFIKEVRRKKSMLNKYDFNDDHEFRRRGLSIQSRHSILKHRPTLKGHEEDSNLGYNKNYNVSILVDQNNYKKRRPSTYMKETLFKRVIDEGIFDSSEEESEDDSYDDTISSSFSGDNININDKKQNNKNNKMYIIKEDVKDEYTSSIGNEDKEFTIIDRNNTRTYSLKEKRNKQNEF